MRAFRRLTASAFICLAVLGLPNAVFAWSHAHEIISRAAYKVQSKPLRDLWSQPHRNPKDTTQRTIDHYLVKYAWWSGNPDHQKAPDYLYREKGWVYHYFGYPEAENRARAERGATWYYTRMVKAFRDGDAVAAATYAGSFAHAIEDRSSPVHAWDGYGTQREAFETQHAAQGLQKPENSFRGNARSFSLFWFLSDAGVKFDLGRYKPKLLGSTIEEAAIETAKRFQAITEKSRGMLTDPRKFLSAHLKDAWQKRASSKPTDAYQILMARESACLVADMFHTAYTLSERPPPTGETDAPK